MEEPLMERSGMSAAFAKTHCLGCGCKLEKADGESHLTLTDPSGVERSFCDEFCLTTARFDGKL